MSGLKFYTIINVIFCGLFLSFVQAQEWTTITPDEQLSGWVIRGGKASFERHGDELVATCLDLRENTFLCTQRLYKDFILEYEMWVHPDVNSGVQIRSHSSLDYRNGRVHGLQVEVDPSDRKFTGGIYDEQRRMWIYPVSQNPAALDAYKNGRWNHFRVEAVGNEIKTWVNGIAVAHLIDDRTESGFIGLQAHAIYRDEDIGKQVKWRNMKIMTEDLDSYRKATPYSLPQISMLVNQLSEREKRQGWHLLWDGHSSAGWRGAKLDHFPSAGWTMSDGVLTINGTDGSESMSYGDIITEGVYSNFHLKLEFKITEGANSGIKYFVDPDLNKGSGSAIGCEYQILDDQNHPDAKMGVNGNRTLASLYDLITAENYSMKGRTKQFKGIGQWNQAEIISRDGHVEHWLNGEKVLEYNRFSQMFRALVAYSKYAKWPMFGQWESGHILLQDHGDTVHYRSIKIKEL